MSAALGGKLYARLYFVTLFFHLAFAAHVKRFVANNHYALELGGNFAFFHAVLYFRFGLGFHLVVIHYEPFVSPRRVRHVHSHYKRVIGIFARIVVFGNSLLYSARQNAFEHGKAVFYARNVGVRNRRRTGLIRFIARIKRGTRAVQHARACDVRKYDAPEIALSA